MTTTINELSSIDVEKKRLYFESWHRGCLEMDMILGPFADRFLSSFSPLEVEEYSKIVASDDEDIYKSFISGEDLPTIGKSEIFEKLRNFFSVFKNEHK